MQITMNINKKGVAIGTIGWLHETLKDYEIEIKNNATGNPVAVLSERVVEQTGEGLLNRKRHLLAIFTSLEECETPRVYTYTEWTQYPRNELFGTPLTQAAFNKLKELEDMAASALSEWLDEGDGVQVTVNPSTSREASE